MTTTTITRRIYGTCYECDQFGVIVQAAKFTRLYKHPESEWPFVVSYPVTIHDAETWNHGGAYVIMADGKGVRLPYDMATANYGICELCEV